MVFKNEAAEQRAIVAHGVNRGIDVGKTIQAPDGAEEMGY
jgi:hypothetical protein